MKTYKILKLYPSLDEIFQVGDIIYYYPMIGEKTIKNNMITCPASVFCYKKIFHQQNDPFITKDEVENNPEFFQQVEIVNIDIKHGHRE